MAAARVVEVIARIRRAPIREQPFETALRDVGLRHVLWHIGQAESGQGITKDPMRIRRQKICGNRVSTTNGFRAHDRSDLCIRAMIEEVRFAEDSPLEEGVTSELVSEAKFPC